MAIVYCVSDHFHVVAAEKPMQLLCNKLRHGGKSNFLVRIDAPLEGHDQVIVDDAVDYSRPTPR